MKAFARRELPPDTLSEALKLVREDAGMSTADLSQRANVQEKYIIALEAGRYDQTPGPAYVRGFLRSIALVLELSPDAVLARYAADPTGLVGRDPVHPGPTAQPLKQSRLTYRMTRILAVGGIILAALVYFGVQVRSVVSPPPLEVTEPASDVIVTEPFITLVGSTAVEVAVTVNDKPVQVDRSGGFRETIDLQPGVNTLVVTASRKRSREARVIRRVIVQLPAVVQ